MSGGVFGVSFPQEMQAARLRLIKKRPYLASAAWALRPVPKASLGTLAVDKYWRIYYDPDSLGHWPVEHIEGVLYHEICHLLRNHAERMKDCDPRLSNIATDAEINDDLVREGVSFPTQPITPGSFGLPDNLLAEEYYAKLQNQLKSPSDRIANGENSDSTNEDNKENGESGIDQPNEGRSNEKQDSGDQKQNDQKQSSKQKGNSGKQQQDQFEKPKPGSGHCGSCATGHKAPWEELSPSEGPIDGLSQIQAELIRRDVAKQIREYAQGQGRVPGHLVRWAEGKLNPKVDWRKKLAAAIRYAIADTVGATDYSYRRPSRRQYRIVFDKFILKPSNIILLLKVHINLGKAFFLAIEFSIASQYFSNRHFLFSSHTTMLHIW
jgi:predicted metal-dependent peptidase